MNAADAKSVLTPPLRVRWSFLGGMGRCFAHSRGIVTQYGIADGLAGLDSEGSLLWKLPGNFNSGFVLDQERVIGVSSNGQKHFLVLDLESGSVRMREGTSFALKAFIPNENAFIGREQLSSAPECSQCAFARVEMSPGLPAKWRYSASWKYAENSPQVLDNEAVHSKGCVYFGHGDYLVCVDSEDGSVLWRSQFIALNRFLAIRKLRPAVWDQLLLVATANGLGAYDTRSGNPRWVSAKAHGYRAVYDGRAYITNSYGDYMIVDLSDGEMVLDCKPMADVSFATYPVVSETHIFVGDATGRLWVLERDTGKPVWSHRPRGTTGYRSVGPPAVTSNRIYINTYSASEKHPSSLYCYEQADG